MKNKNTEEYIQLHYQQLLSKYKSVSTCKECKLLEVIQGQLTCKAFILSKNNCMIIKQYG